MYKNHTKQMAVFAVDMLGKLLPKNHQTHTQVHGNSSSVLPSSTGGCLYQLQPTTTLTSNTTPTTITTTPTTPTTITTTTTTTTTILLLLLPLLLLVIAAVVVSCTA